MRKLLPLLALLLLGPAMAQEVIPGPYIPPPIETGNIIYTTLNPPPQGAQFNWNGFIPNNTNGGGLQGGNIPAYNTQTGTFIWGYMQGTVTYNFFGNNDWPSSGIEVDGFKYSWEYFNQDFSRGNISGNIKIFGPNNNLLENYNFAMPRTTEGWTVYSGQIDFANPYDRSELGRLQLSFTGKDDRFWAGYWGPQVRDLDVSILYHTPMPPPPMFPYWSIIAGEWGTFTITEPSTVRYGGEGVYLYAEFQPGTYACNNFEWGKDPIGGVQKSCEVGVMVDPNPPQTDCSLYPNDPNCAVLVYTDPKTIADNIVDDVLADILDTSDNTNTGVDDGSDDGTEVVEDEEEVLVSDNTEQTDIEEMLTDEDTVTDDEEETVVSETTAAVIQETGSSATYRELTDEEKAQILADSIAKNTLEMALSVAENASTSNQSTATTEATTSTNRTTIVAATESTENTIADNKNDTEQQSTDNSTDTAVDLLENGRQLNNISLAAVQSQTEQSASDSINQAETIAISSSDSKISDITIDLNISNSNDANNTSMVANDDSDIETNAETKSVESIVEEITTNSVEQSVASIDNIDSFNDIINLEIKPVTEIKDEDLEFVQSVLAQSEQKKDDNANTFSEDEQVTIQNDPNLANAFNVVPNVSNLEILGVLNNKQEEKSDAEKKAEQVVAANAKEQEDINKNYMDADQSGIVAAMGADTDVTSYRSAMLNDNNIWYKPEDIYKNVVYKDNVRGAYFLEKGNTDTYKKMVEEQYK